MYKVFDDIWNKLNTVEKVIVVWSALVVLVIFGFIFLGVYAHGVDIGKNYFVNMETYSDTCIKDCLNIGECMKVCKR